MAEIVPNFKKIVVYPSSIAWLKPFTSDKQVIMYHFSIVNRNFVTVQLKDSSFELTTLGWPAVTATRRTTPHNDQQDENLSLAFRDCKLHLLKRY